jgi:cytochrome c551/c552
MLACVALLATAECRNSYNADASQLTGGDPRRGSAAIGRYGCGACHDIPGIKNARGTVGPPLARIASRSYLAGRVINTPALTRRHCQNCQDCQDCQN